MSTAGRLIAMDWGTTNIRAALLDATGAVLDERSGESGVGVLDKKGFETRFEALVADWPVAPALAAGMVGSRQGWHEAAYLACPTSMDGLAKNLSRFEHMGRTVAIVPGLKMQTSHHHDVMRGEETQIVGLLASRPGFEGTLVLPGTHSKWVHIKGGAVERFHTYMTGDMFSALSGHTMLRPSVTGDVAVGSSEQSGGAMFRQAVQDIFTAGGSGLRQFFDLRARSLLADQGADQGRERLSGLLIGMEFQAAAQDGYDVQNVVFIGSRDLIARYRSAGIVLGAQMQSHQGTDLIWPALYRLAHEAELF
ncbi:MAG: 2-dehydro-3-deoxygalactonokinase [Pseudomonadota bacterium]